MIGSNVIPLQFLGLWTQVHKYSDFITTEIWVVLRSQTTFFLLYWGRKTRVWNTEQQLLVPLIHDSAGVSVD